MWDSMGVKSLREGTDFFFFTKLRKVNDRYNPSYHLEISV